MRTAEQEVLDALGHGQGSWTRETARALTALVERKDAEIERLRAVLRRAAPVVELAAEWELTAEIDRLLGNEQSTRVGEYRADYEPLTPEEMATEDEAVTDLISRSKPCL